MNDHPPVEELLIAGQVRLAVALGPAGDDACLGRCLACGDDRPNTMSVSAKGWLPRSTLAPRRDVTCRRISPTNPFASRCCPSRPRPLGRGRPLSHPGKETRT